MILTFIKKCVKVKYPFLFSWVWVFMKKRDDLLLSHKSVVIPKLYKQNTVCSQTCVVSKQRKLVAKDAVEVVFYC